MKILPCRHCAEGQARGPDGAAYWLQRYSGYAGAPMRYKCFACGVGYTITPQEFHALPAANVEALGEELARHVTQSHLNAAGGALTLDQAMYLLEHGHSPEAVAEMASDPPPRAAD